jgi:hypothetical protein
MFSFYFFKLANFCFRHEMATTLPFQLVNKKPKPKKKKQKKILYRFFMGNEWRYYNVSDFPFPRCPADPPPPPKEEEEAPTCCYEALDGGAPSWVHMCAF